MTGYFSRLAHHTGLTFEPGADVTASRVTTAPTVAVQPPENTPPAPLHVEEMTFTAAPASGAVEGHGEGLAGVSPIGANSLPDRDAPASTADGWNPKQTEWTDDDHCGDGRGLHSTERHEDTIRPGEHAGG